MQLVAATAICPFPRPAGEGWDGGGFAILGNKIRANRRATLSPSLSRRTGEGTGYQSKRGRLKTLGFGF